MKRTIFTLFLLTLIIYLGCSGKLAENFSYQPEFPQPGQEITVSYNPSETALKAATEISLLAYCFPEGTPVVKAVPMAQNGDLWTAAFTTDDTTLAITIIFKSDDLKDDNEKDGYQISLFNQDRKPVKGSLARQAMIAYSGGSYPLRLNRDRAKAREYFEKEFENYPEQKGNPDISGNYWSAFYRTHKDSATLIIKSELGEIARKETKSIEELSLLHKWYLTFNEKKLAEKCEKELIEKEPKGKFVEQQRARGIYREKSIDKKCDLIAAFSEDFPGSEMIEWLQNNIVSAYARAGQYEKAENYLNKHVKKPVSYILNSLAWSMLEKGMLLEKAVELAKQAVEVSRDELATKEKPGSFTQQEWQKTMENSLGNALDTYGFGLYKLGRIKESVPVFEEAVSMTHEKNNEIRERYCRSLYESGMLSKAFTESEALVKDEPSKKTIRELFRQIYVEKNGNDKGLDALFADLDQKDRQKKNDELKAKMTEKPAPGFTLNDLEGNPVSLKDFAGKIVILDFWATWCGPCVRSFPAMQKAVEKYESDEKVEFIFINTWERGDGTDKTTKKVKDFIQTKKYTFRVLRDIENSVVSDYKVEGIPTKFIIDPKGKIRFKSVGYRGDEALIAELDSMIEMVRGN